MHHEIECKWQGKMEFEGKLNGHTIILDTTPSGGGENHGTSPKILLLLSAAGCTGMDVIPMLKKMQVPITGLNIRAVADGTDVDPKVYTSMKITFEFIGDNLESHRDKLERAVSLSQEKYCGVSAMLSKAMEIMTEVVIV